VSKAQIRFRKRWASSSESSKPTRLIETGAVARRLGMNERKRAQVVSCVFHPIHYFTDYDPYSIDCWSESIRHGRLRQRALTLAHWQCSKRRTTRLDSKPSVRVDYVSAFFSVLYYPSGPAKISGNLGKDWEGEKGARCYGSFGYRG
jgi:hypothetical protein